MKGDLEAAYQAQFSRLFEGLFVNLQNAHAADGSVRDRDVAIAEQKFHTGCVLLDRAYAIAKDLSA